MNIETIFPCCNHSSCSYWPLEDTFLMCFNVSDGQPSVCANMHLKFIRSSYPNQWNQVDTFQSYHLFTANVPLFITILSLPFNRERLSGETKRNFVLKHFNFGRYPLNSTNMEDFSLTLNSEELWNMFFHKMRTVNFVHLHWKCIWRIF